MNANAPIVQPHIRTIGAAPAPTKASNIAQTCEFGHGDMEAGFEQADVAIERSYKTEQFRCRAFKAVEALNTLLQAPFDE